MAIKAITTVPPGPDEQNEQAHAKRVDVPANVVSFSRVVGMKAAAAIEEVDQEDTAPADFVVTPEVRAELNLGSDLSIDMIDDEEEEGDYGAVLEYDEKGNPVSIDGYLPGLTPHPADVAPVMPVIGAGMKSEANSTARKEMIEQAKKRGYARVLQHVLQYHHDGHVPEPEESFDKNQRRKQAVRFLVGGLDVYEENGVDPTDEDLFQHVSEALVSLFRSKWQLHVTDIAVDTIARNLVDEDTTEEDLMASLILLDFSTLEWHFEALQKVAEFAADYGDEARHRGNKTDLSAMKFADMVEDMYLNAEDKNLSFDLFLQIAHEATSWDEFKYYVAILRKSFEGRDDTKSALTEQIKEKKFKSRILSTLLAIKERDPKSFIDKLHTILQQKTVDAVARKAVQLLNQSE